METDPFLSHFHVQLGQLEGKAGGKTIEKLKNLLKVLSAQKIQRKSLESICFTGIPDECKGLRALCWKLLLNFLPETPSKWKSTLETHRKDYENYLQDYYVPRLAMKKKEEASKQMEQKSGENKEQAKPPKKKAFVIEADGDHPLSTEKSSTWNKYFQDNDLFDDIEKDTKRTRSEMDFFQQQTKYPLKYINDLVVKSDNEPSETHFNVLTRILFIYGKLNASVGYVQGMNEIIAPIYYCFSNDTNPLFVGHAEADSFYCFSRLMGEIQDGFVKKLDNTEVGIQAKIKILNDLLRRTDKPLWAHLEKHNINPQFYSLRWLMLLLTQEFTMSEVFRLWDCLLSHPRKLQFLNYVCLAMIQGVRDKIIKDDEFATLMETLQKETNGDLEKTLMRASILYKAHCEPEHMEHHLIFQQS